MANIFSKGTKFAQTALALLQREVKLPGILTYKYGVSDFKGAEGDTLNVKRPTLLRARDKGWRSANAVVVDDLIKSTIPVALDSHPYSAVHLSPEEATLDEVDYVRDVQAPQVRALVEFVEEKIVAALAGATFVHTLAYAEATDDPRKIAIAARKMLNTSKVPAGDRYWLVGADVSEAITAYDKILDQNTSGIPEALLDGFIGRLGGFAIIESLALAEDESYFMHGSAVALAVVAPTVPMGAAKGGGVAAGNGIAVTQVWDYDGSNMKDRSVVHAFAGAAVVTDPVLLADGRISVTDDVVDMEFVRAVKVTFTPVGS